MSEPTCRWVSTTQPRVIPGRHDDQCEGESCRGCQPCHESHCLVCGKEHTTVGGVGTDLTCGTCLAATRADLREIGNLAARMLGEAIVKGINSTAAMHAGPAGDVEAWGYRRMSALAGRIDAEWLEDCKDELHPLWVTGTWDLLVREHLHQPSSARLTLSAARAYLDGHLTRLAHDADFAFEELARDLHNCRGHLEDVLRDGQRDERTRVTCDVLSCKKRPRLIRQANDNGLTGKWVCPACDTVYDHDAYRDAHAKQLRHAGAAKYLPQTDVLSTLVSQGRSERTARKWLEPPLKHAKDKCFTCGKTYRPGDWTVCPRDGGELKPVTLGDPEAVVNGYCDLRTRKTWLWWPDMWRLHVSVKKRKRAA